MNQKIKEWIICKLGGLPGTRRVKPQIIQTEPRSVIKIQVVRAIPKFQIELMDPEEEVCVANRCLANLLGNYLMDNGYVTVTAREDSDEKVFYAELKIVKEGAV